ncbi:MAG: glycosyltransferase [Spirochaetota bacterium]
MSNPEISVIVPTYNEAEYLPKLLDCLKAQTLRSFEIIVADNASDDGTREIATSYGARLAPGGLPPEGRNRGAAEAKGDYFFFFDADVKFSKHFLKQALGEMKKRNAELATCETVPLSNLHLDRFMHSFANFFVKLNLERDPHAPGFCIMVSRRVFEAVGGFDESLKLAEDHDFVKRAAEHVPLVFLEKVRVTVSVRRYRKEGRLDYMRKVVQIARHRARHGEVTDDTFDYAFGDFDTVDETRLRKLEKQINKLDKAIMKFRKRNLRPLANNEEPEVVTQFKDQIDKLFANVSSLFKSS